MNQIAGDGRNTGKKQKHVLFTVTIMGTGRELKPEEALTVALVVGSEKYDLISEVYQFINDELAEIKENGFKVFWSFVCTFNSCVY